MKKWLLGMLVTLLMIGASCTALAAEAVDITDECKFKVAYTGRKYTQMTDKKYTSYWESKSVKNPYIALTAPEDKPIAGLYICFGNMPTSWEVQISDDGEDWFKAVEGDTRFLHSYVELPEPSQYARVIVSSDKKYTLRVNEIFALSEGELPDWVQVWEPTHEKADILFISTHPDDELIFFGGAIPTYAAEMQRKVVVAYFTRSNTTRSSELLNGLWHMGVRNYPVIGDFRDSKAKNVTAAYKNAGGKSAVNEWVVGLYRQYKPEVVVTQDVDGEYGHTQHKMVSEAAFNAIEIAADEDQYTDLTVAYGTWAVKKFYRHLWPENQITFDWSVPLASMNGYTGLELADEAYRIYHKTQASSGFSVMETGVEYDNRIFGLVYSTVGEDVQKNDFLENIELTETAPVEKQEVVADTTRYAHLLPALNERGFMDAGEFIYSSEEEGLWIFIDETSKIIIERKYDATQPLTWFEADIYTDVEAGEMLKTIWNDEEKRTKVRVDAAETAIKNGVVFAMNTDYFTYRVDVDASGRVTGVVVRDGEILYDEPYTEQKANVSGLFPNLDMLAFFKDGSMNVYRSYEITAQELVDQGAYAVYSFGPYLMKDGKLSAMAYDSSESKNPRCAIGMVEPGHYVAIMAEGRLKRSEGVTVSYLAKLMRAKGCENAFNLDGGQTAVMIFMGKQINQIGAYDGGKTNSRKTCEVMGVGYSDQVGIYEVQ
ncbi:MAG: phosphodiester glycosidase family protein [Clostridia bacterium]|nr:phosphodiester glycosidase family protein [Clostridia bacterium]